MSKGLENLILKHKAAIVSQWFEAVVQSYPADTAEFLQGQTDPFANPVGSITRDNLQGLLEHLFEAPDVNAAGRHLDPILRVRALQNFSPSQATAFVFELKAVLRRILKKDLDRPGLAGDLARLEDGIDRLGLMAFDIYMACKEQVYRLKANETRNRVFRAFEKAGLVKEDPERGPDH
jgi:hypothetical protein